MKKQIRQSVFETNSSSTHSITIDYNGKLDETMTPNEDNQIILEGGQFGWEVEDYNEAWYKANYCAVASLWSEKRQQMLKEVIMEMTGCTEVIIEASTEYDSPYYSYIDHQSSDTAGEAFTDKESLKSFIFNSNSFLHTNNDNH